VPAAQVDRFDAEEPAHYVAARPVGLPDEHHAARHVPEHQGQEMQCPFLKQLLPITL
jgi:hypothetical protein